MTPEHMAELFSQAIDVAVAPIGARLAVAEARLAAYDFPESRKHVSDLRERLAVQETRTQPLLGKVAELDARPYATKDLWNALELTVVDLRAKVAQLESKALAPGPAGPEGEPGPIGPAGVPGLVGPPGAVGSVGPMGPAGAEGQKGIEGGRGADGRDGVNGKDGALGPQGQKGIEGGRGADGRDGVNGKDGALGPQGQKGLDGGTGPQGERGADGALGLNGKDGRDGLASKDGAPGLQGQKGFDGLSGKDGLDGLNGKDGAPGPEGQKGLDGRHGIGIADALLGRDGQLVLTFSDGTTKSVTGVAGKDGAPGLNGKDADQDAILSVLTKQIDEWQRPVNGKDGRDGADGKDGLGFDDLDVVFSEEKGYRLLFKRADLEREFPIAVPFYVGVYEPGRCYVKGARVTFKASEFAAMDQTRGTEPEQSRAWRLAVKRGKDGKDGKDGKNGGDE